VIYTVGTAAVAALFAYLPAHDGLTEPGRHALFVLLTAASWWITGAIPAFAVSLAVIALQIALLGDPSGPFADGDVERWQRFISPWASPVMWLFLSGLVLAAAATRTGLDRRLAERVLALAGSDPARVLLAVMGVTFVLSMFMSNTATTAMMIALVLAMPAVSERGEGYDERYATALLLGIPVAANIGGMGTIIGTPPNAIAATALVGTGRIDFAMWMVYGLPPALLLGAIAWRWLVWRYLRLATAAPTPTARAERSSPMTGRHVIVAALFLITVTAWLTESLHGIPTAVVAVMPIAVLAVSGVIRERDVRALPWDVLMLIAGGLSLGVGVSETGLAEWIVGRLPVAGLPVPMLALLVALVGTLLSTFISNTAAATILTPLAVALADGDARLVAVPLALAMSAAMSLPVSTPPNAIAFATERLPRSALRQVGVLLGVGTPLVAIGWTWIVERFVR
jgi:solute carrier family 13 (sodium-dependent dicarboxylate transporter), member 2/3/5